MKNQTILAMAALTVLGLAACKPSSTTETSSMDSNGTTTETSTTATENGNGTTDVDSKTTTDPQGMMNKTTTEETHTESH